MLLLATEPNGLWNEISLKTSWRTISTKDFICDRTQKQFKQTHTLRHADLLAVLALELVLLEGALPLLDVGFLLVLVQVEDEEAELALEHVLLPLGQLLLTLPQELFVGLLLQSRSLQLLLTASQLLMEKEGLSDERDVEPQVSFQYST